MGDPSYLVNGRGLLALAIPETRQDPISTFHLPEKHVETVATLCYVVKNRPGFVYKLDCGILPLVVLPKHIKKKLGIFF